MEDQSQNINQSLPVSPVAQTPLPTPPETKRNLSFSVILALVLLGILIVGGIIFVAYGILHPKKPSSQTHSANSLPAHKTQDWLTYQSIPGNFVVKYPKYGWDISPNNTSGVDIFNLLPPPGVESVENVSFLRQGTVMPTQNDMMYVTVWKTNGATNAKSALENTLSKMSSAPGFSGGTITPIQLDLQNGYKLTYNFSTSIQLEQIAVDSNNSTYIISGGQTSQFESFLSSFTFTPALSQILISPPVPPTFPCEDGVLSWQVGNLCSDGGSWTDGSYTCTDGASGKVNSSTCTTAQSLRDKAVKICATSPKTCPFPSISPTPGPNLSALLEYATPTGWETIQSDASQISLQSPTYNYSSFGGGGVQQGEKITITRTTNTAGATLDMYKSGPFKSFAETTHDGLPAFVGIVSFAGLFDQANNLVYDYIIIKKGYIWDIQYTFYSPDSKKGAEYQQQFNSFLDSLHLR